MILAGMFSRRAAASGGGSAADPSYASVVSLLHFDGADGSLAAPTDEKGLVWTQAGNAQLDTAQSKFGGASALFDGSGDYYRSPNVAGFAFDTGDFTIEAWIRPGLLAADRTFFRVENPSVRWIGLLGTGGVLRWYNSSVGTVILGTTALTTTAFHHVAISKAAGTTRMFLDGTLQGSSTNATSVGGATTSAFALGEALASASHLGWNGWIDDVRITKGVGRYTAAFTPPTAAFPNS